MSNLNSKIILQIIDAVIFLSIVKEELYNNKKYINLRNTTARGLRLVITISFCSTLYQRHADYIPEACRHTKPQLVHIRIVYEMKAHCSPHCSPHHAPYVDKVSLIRHLTSSGTCHVNDRQRILFITPGYHT